MGWKTSLIFINRPPKIANEQILKTLGLKGLSQKKDTVLDDFISSRSNYTCIGYYNDFLIVYNWKIPEKVIEKNNTDIEKQIINLFPNSEICFVALVSTVNFWGYKVINNGKLIRHRAGSADDGTYFDFGEVLDEEKDLLSKSIIDENGIRTYKFDHDDDLLSEDQVGEEFVFNVCSRYLRVPLDEADEFSTITKFSCYKRNWWKFW